VASPIVVVSTFSVFSHMHALLCAYEVVEGRVVDG